MSLPTLPSIAVLPFVNMSSDPENEYFSDGITEEIINALTRIPGLKVTARTSSFAFKNHNDQIEKIGEQLGVQTLLEGSVRLFQARVRVTAQMISVEDGFHYWSEVYDRDLEDVFHLQEEISNEIAQRIREHYGHLEWESLMRVSKQPTLNAYQYYLKANFLLNQGLPQNYQVAIEHLDAALRIDPTFALAKAKRSECYSYLGLFRLMSGDEAFTQAEKAATEALALDEDLAEAQLAMATACFCKDWNLGRATQYLLKAAELNPQHPGIKGTYAIYLASTSKFKRGVKEVTQALQSDPFSINLQSEKALMHLMRQEYAACHSQADQLLAINPQFTSAAYLKGRAYFEQRSFELAIQTFEAIPTWTGLLADGGWLACCHHQLGQVEKAEALFARPLPLPLQADPNFYHYPRILYLTLTGQEQAAIELLRDGLAQRAYTLLSFYADSNWQPLRRWPEFLALEKAYHHDFSMPDPAYFGKYRGNRLSFTDSQQIADRLRTYLETQKPYLDPELNLPKLAELLAVNHHHLSQVINQHFQQNFFELINSYRIEALKSRLHSPEASQFTLLAHAFECGFNSKTTFNVTFKRLVGLTPSAYLKSVKDRGIG